MIAADPFLLMWLTLALAGLSIIAYAHPRLPLELTSVGLVAALRRSSPTVTWNGHGSCCWSSRTCGTSTACMTFRYSGPVRS